MQNGILRQPSPVKITGPCCEIQIQSIVAFTAFKSPVCFRRESVKPNTENSLSAHFVPFQHTFEGRIASGVSLRLSVECVGVYRVELRRSQQD